MKPIVKIGNWWFFPKGVIAMTIFPFIFVDINYSGHTTVDKMMVTLTHEKIHLRQQIEMLVIFFYLWYGIEYLIRSIKPSALNPDSYYRLSFEREAYLNDKNPAYLKTRKFWVFLKYL